MHEKWARKAVLEPSVSVSFSLEKRGSFGSERLNIYTGNGSKWHSGAAECADYTCCRGETQEGSPPASCCCVGFYFERGMGSLPECRKRDLSRITSKIKQVQGHFT